MTTLPDFRTICTAVGYRPKGIFFSELFLFLRACQQAFVDIIIESGVKNGTSTDVLAAAFPGPMISIDLVPPTRWGVTPGNTLLVGHRAFITGDAAVLIPEQLDKLGGATKVAVLIDGPKGDRARALRDVCLARPNVRLVAIHDEPLGGGETRHSHDATFREYYGQGLDELVPAEWRKKYPKGPGLAIWSRA